MADAPCGGEWILKTTFTGSKRACFVLKTTFDKELALEYGAVGLAPCYLQDRGNLISNDHREITYTSSERKLQHGQAA